MIAYIIQFILLIIVVVSLVIYYSERQVPLYVQFLVTISWILSLIIILILPVDIYETKTGYKNKQIKELWMTIYYINFVLTWFILPFAQQYQDAGQFTVKGKIQRSIRNNVLLILIFLALGVIILVYLLVSHQFEFRKLPSIFATIANVFGIGLVIVFLGHGLISLPKQSFNRRSAKKQIEIYEKTVQMINTHKEENEFDIQIQIRKINYIRGSSRNYEFQGFCATILQIIPTYLKEEAKGDSKTFEIHELQNITYAKIADINRIVKRKISELRMYETRLEEIIIEVQKIERSAIKNNYKCQKIGYLLMMIFTSLLAIIIFFGQIATFITIFEKASLLHYINYIKSTALVYLLNSLVLLYITYVITHSIFSMKIFGLYSLHRRHSTAASLLFTSINLSRISYPLCYNYLQITGMPKIAFLQFFGQISIGQNLNFIFPILLIIFALFNLFDIYDKIMGFLGLTNYSFNDQQNEQNRREGRRIIDEIMKKKQGFRGSRHSKTGESYLQLGSL